MRLSEHPLSYVSEINTGIQQLVRAALILRRLSTSESATHAAHGHCDAFALGDPNRRCSAQVHWIADIVQNALVHWGYLALAIGLLGEDAGLPLPGETVLMFASFLSKKHGELSLAIIIPVGIAAAVLGDNCGFWIGRKLGPRILRWLREKAKLREDVAVAEDQIHRHGGATVFWARYIFGLRTVTGPVAGALGMDWRKFLFFNVLGACTWVTFISMAGFGFAHGFDNFIGYFEKASWAISGGVFAIGYFLWKREKKHYRERSAQG